MTLNEKIRKIRKEKNLTIVKLHQLLKKIFGDKALEYNTLARIEQGKTSPRINSLLQICIGLGITLTELKEGIEEEFGLVNLVRKNRRLDRFTYNQSAFAEILTPSKRKFLCAELKLSPKTITTLEQDPATEERFEKWVYCLKGLLICHIGQEVHKLNKGDCLSFESTLPHYFENNTVKPASCLIVQNPRHI